MTLINFRLFVIFVALLVGHDVRRKKKSRRKRGSVYTKAERNIIIDSVVHPLADEHWSFVVVDGVLHALNEEDPIQSLFKFLKYNAPELPKRILKHIR